MGFKNKKEYKKEKKKWKSGMSQQRSPAGYKSFKEKQSSYNNKGKEGSNNDLQIKKKSGSGLKTKSKFDAKKFAERDAAFKSDMEARIKKAERYKPKELKIKGSAGKPITSKNLPDRPTAPKMPTINLPNGSLITDKVANPSGLSGQSNRYSTKTMGASDLKSAYKYGRTDGADALAKFKKRVKS